MPEPTPGFIVEVVSRAPDERIQGSIDPRTLGQVLDRMTDVSERVESFTFEDCERDHDILRLEVNNHDLYFFDHPAWVKGNLVRFAFGYPGKLFGPRYAVVDTFRGFRKLSIVCYEQAILSNEARNRLWESTTRWQIVADMISEGYFPGVTELDIGAVAPIAINANKVNVTPWLAQAIQLMNLQQEKPRDFQQSTMTDWQYIQTLAEEIGAEVYTENTVLHFHPRRLNQPPVRSYTWWHGDGELVDFDIDELRAVDRAQEIEVVGFDPVEQKPVSATGSNQDTKRDTLGSQGSLVITANSPTGKLGVKKVQLSASAQADEVKNVADTHFRNSEQEEVEATAVIRGDPWLPAKSIIEINGISRMLSGNFYVEQHNHVITRGGGYLGTLKLKRNALTAVPSTQPPTLDKTKADENTQDPSTGRDLSVVEGPTGKLRQVRR